MITILSQYLKSRAKEGKTERERKRKRERETQRERGREEEKETKNHSHLKTPPFKAIRGKKILIF